MVISRKEKILRNKIHKPTMTSHMINAVSDYRREQLYKDVSNGVFRDPNEHLISQAEQYTNTSSISNVVSGTVNKYGLQRYATSAGVQSTSGTGGYRGSGGTVRQMPEIYSPLWLTSNLNLPRDRATINAWCRSFFTLNPIVQNAISLHSTYPISKLNITCKDPKVQQYFDTLNEELGIENICTQVAQEYFVLGESFPHAELNINLGKWSRIVVQNPDYISVQNSVVAGSPIISLRPDENLKRMVTSNRPSDIQQRRKIDRSIIEYIRKGRNIPLNNLNITHIARKIAPYERRGTSIIVSCFRQLMLFDLIRECKFSQAYDMINPLTLIKIGNDKYRPTPVDLELFRDVWEQAQYDKDFKIFTHEAVDVSKVGNQGAIIDTSGDITQLLKEIYIGLMVPQVLMDGGSDVTYSNGGVTLDVLKQRYTQLRNMLSFWLRNKIYAPISKINDFYEYKDGVKVLIVPEVEWNHMSLFETYDYIGVLTSLAQGEDKSISQHTLHRSLGVETEDEYIKIKQEAIQKAILEKEKEILAKMSLDELRALSPTEEIRESIETPLPGEEEMRTAPETGGEPREGLPSLPGMEFGSGPEMPSETLSESPPAETTEAPIQ